MRKSLPDPNATWTDDDARQVFAEWRRGKQPLAPFAREHGIGVKRLYWWRRRLEAGVPPSMEFVPAVVTSVEETPIVVRLASNVTIEIASASPRLIAEIIMTLTGSKS